MAKEQPKVLFVLPEYYPHSGGGISTYYIQYIKALAPHCSAMKVIVGSGYLQKTDKFDLADNVKVEYLSPDLYNSYLQKFDKFSFIPEYKSNIAAAWAMWEQAAEGKGYDIVECTDFAMGYIPWAIHHATPLVVRLHGSSGQIEINEPELEQAIFGDFCRSTETLLLAKASCLISHSKQNAEFWRPILPATKIEYIPPVFEMKLTQRPVSQKEDFAMICGRVQQWKGPDVLCKSLQELQCPELEFRWIGRDTVYRAGRSKANQLSQDYPMIWGKQIRLNAPLPTEELSTLQEKAKYAIVPSTWDMFNFTVLEYMANGTPVLCSVGAGASELIVHSKNGFTFGINDSKALAQLIEKMSNIDANEYDELVNEAHQTIKNLAGSKIIPLNLQVYQEVIEKFSVSKLNNYLASAYLPTTKRGYMDQLLDQISLKKLSAYLMNRIKKKYAK
ncbi:hypothetical protein DBR40_17105 [Pedobacter sp. KBW01]|uniref:glycosyltransferase family 4 protein n=1 Tax=Pedobacter sp. KBW01 TaxID=2153364 RepID=UPI000F5AFC55|nr:glycosyltransferase family 4 protein [Pedobacter sp. KBW01]RQO71516.1 hypothetical protein DBR40_17105 [Pedobacter sp. KBW01]